MLYLNAEPVTVTMFPDNTSQVWKLPEHLLNPASIAQVKWQFSSESEFLHLAQLKALLDHQHVPAELHIEYLPYGRQDKAVRNDKTFALSVFANLLNSLNFRKVWILDPHSVVALNLINNSEARYPAFTLYKTLEELQIDLICYPDEGARRKYRDVYASFGKFIYGEKVRDQLSGEITHYELHGDPNGQKVLMCDDLADGGATFKLLAKMLLQKGATEVNLFVTHGIFSKGIRTLKEAGINRIFTHEGEVGPRHQNFYL